MKGIVGAVLLMLILAGCDKGENLKQTPVKNSSDNYKLRDSAINLIKTGDIVLRLGNDVTSYMLSQLNVREKSFSHCGVASIENGSVWIYHSIGGEYNPDQKIKRETAGKWFSPQHNLALGIVRWDMDSFEKKNFVAAIIQYYKEGKKFDMHFDLQSDDRLYCAEMIYKAALHTTKDTAYLPLTSALGKNYIGVDDLFLNKHAHTICRLQYK